MGKSVKKTGCKSQISTKNNKKLRKKNSNKCQKKNYSAKDVSEAIKALNKGDSLRAVARTFNIPPATLCRKQRNPDTLHKKSGPGTILSAEEEENIVNWVLFKAERGYPATKTQLLDHVQLYIRKLKKSTPFKNDRPGRHWLEGFLKRHPNLANRTAQHLTIVRASVTEEDLREWFAEVQTFLENMNLKDIDSSRVFNCDESNIQLCPKPERVIVEKGTRTVYKVVDAGEKESLTALFMYSAAGKRAPPMAMYPYKETLPKKITEKCPEGISMGISEKGWMDIEAFYEYITLVFYPWLLKEQIEFPVILYLDGHSSHVTVPLVKFLLARKIEIISLFPNATHIMQPLDIAFFHPFKETWKKTVAIWRVENNTVRLGREHFASVLLKALESFVGAKDAVVHGFRSAGLVPFNPEAVDYNIMKKRKKRSLQSLPPNVEDKKNHVTTFENNLSLKILQQFKDCEHSGIWTGSAPLTGLFFYWTQIKAAALESQGAVQDKNVRLIDHESLNVELNDIIPPQPLNPQPTIQVVHVENAEINDMNTQEERPITELLEPVNSEAPLHMSNEGVAIINQLLNQDQVEFTEQMILNTDINQSLTTSTEEEVNEPTHKSSPEVRQTPSASFEDIHLTLAETNLEAEAKVGAVQEEINVQSKVVSTQTIEPIKHSAEALLVSQVPATVNEVGETNIKDIKITDSNDKENYNVNQNRETDLDPKEVFNEVFTLPEKYLSKAKKIRLDKKGKKKMPAVGTSEAWLKIQEDKEKKQKEKEEKLAKKKMLQEQKKQIAAEKKKLDEKMKEIALKIKSEKC